MREIILEVISDLPAAIASATAAVLVVCLMYVLCAVIAGA